LTSTANEQNLIWKNESTIWFIHEMMKATEVMHEAITMVF